MRCVILHAIVKVHHCRNQSHAVDILTASQNYVKTKHLGEILQHIFFTFEGPRYDC